MAFNHYAKIKRIINEQPIGWYIKRINEPTSAKNFRGDVITYEHYYRIYDRNDMPIKYCKFQKLELLASTLKIDVENLPVID